METIGLIYLNTLYVISIIMFIIMIRKTFKKKINNE